MRRVVTLNFLLIIAVSGIFGVDIYREIILPGQQLVGTPYMMGGVNPSGFDCSGFVTYLFKKFVPNLPRVSRQMASLGAPVKRDSLLPGDLVFFATGASSSSITHVAIYIGQNSIIHSISNGPDRGVTITNLSARYWNNKYYSSVRLLKESTASSGGSDGGSETQDSGSGIKKVTDVKYARGEYTGETVKGEPEGKGVFLMNNGDRYEGSFSKGVFEGTGTYYWSDGRTYTGEFKKGQAAESAVEEENYLLKKDSPWETWDGIVDGDFQLYLQQDKDAFKEWQKNN